jgi:hypothetical protein
MNRDDAKGDEAANSFIIDALICCHMMKWFSSSGT